MPPPDLLDLDLPDGVAPDDVCVTPAPYLPFADPLTARVPGLWALDPRDWVQTDAAFNAQIALRDAAVTADPDRVCQSVGGSVAEAIVAEHLAILRDHLLAHVPGYAAAPGGGLTRPDGVRLKTTRDLQALARMVQEDWLFLHAPAARAETILVAAALCFPAHWTLADKIGRPLGAVHAPVPDYDRDVAPRVNRVFAALHPGRPLQRLNWSLAATPELRTHGAKTGGTDWIPRYLRVERQSMRRLPRTGGIVFGVKTYMTPLASLNAQQASALRDAVAQMPARMRDYKWGTLETLTFDPPPP